MGIHAQKILSNVKMDSHAYRSQAYVTRFPIAHKTRMRRINSVETPQFAVKPCTANTVANQQKKDLFATVQLVISYYTYIINGRLKNDILVSGKEYNGTECVGKGFILIYFKII